MHRTIIIAVACAVVGRAAHSEAINVGGHHQQYQTVQCPTSNQQFDVCILPFDSPPRGKYVVIRKSRCHALPGSSSPSAYLETIVRGNLAARHNLVGDDLLLVARDTDRLRAYVKFSPRPTPDENRFACTISGELFDK